MVEIEPPRAMDFPCPARHDHGRFGRNTLRAALKDGTFALPKALEGHLAAVRDVLKKVSPAS